MYQIPSLPLRQEVETKAGVVVGTGVWCKGHRKDELLRPMLDMGFTMYKLRRLCE